MGPILAREAVALPRRVQFYLFRAIFSTALIVFVATAWLMITGTQRVLGQGDMARFAGIVFQLLAALQMFIVVFASAILAASAVAQEKDRKTLPLLLMTRMNRFELVVGKLSASLLEVLAVVMAALPVFFLLMPLGGVSASQIGRMAIVTIVAIVEAGSLGILIGYWREKTFQSLALVVLVLSFWLAGWEIAIQSASGTDEAATVISHLAVLFSPLRAVVAAADPLATVSPAVHPAVAFSCMSLGLSLIMNGITMLRLRRWTTGDAVHEGGTRVRADGTWDTLPGVLEVDRPVPAGAGPVATAWFRSRRNGDVWENPVLWRECATWAYGRKVLFIRLAYLALAILVGGLAVRATDPESLECARQLNQIMPPAIWPMVTLFLLSWALLNALAVTSITTERDGRALDLLLATDLTPQEFIFGKMGGTASVAGLMLVVPLLLCGVVWWRGAISTQNVLYLVGTLLTIDAFVVMLGIHCGIRYSHSRGAIGVSMGTFFFLSLGVATCIMMMVSFSSSFHIQLVPFVAIILGGGVGLLAALGAGNPSAAMVVAALVVPFATFYVITCVLLQQPLPAFLVAVGSYGFATAAMMVPALFEFDFAMGRSTTTQE